MIAATNRDLQKEVERGHFRALAQHFITRSARRLNLRAPRLTPAALDTLASRLEAFGLRPTRGPARRRR